MKYKYFHGPELALQLSKIEQPMPKYFGWTKRWAKNYHVGGVDDRYVGVCAYHKGKIVAFFAIQLDQHGFGTHGANGTWVSKSFRGRGLAMKLWARMLDYQQGVIMVGAISPGGRALTTKLAKKYADRVFLTWK